MKLKELFLMMFCAFPLLSFAAEQQIVLRKESSKVFKHGVRILGAMEGYFLCFTLIPLLGMKLIVLE